MLRAMCHVVENFYLLKVVYKQGKRAHFPLTNRAMKNGIDATCSDRFGRALCVSPSCKEVLKPQTLGIKTLIGERQNPLEGVRRGMMDESQI